MENNIIQNEEVNEKVEKALIALNEYSSFTQEEIDYIVAKASVAALDKHGELAKLAVEEWSFIGQQCSLRKIPDLIVFFSF